MGSRGSHASRSASGVKITAHKESAPQLTTAAGSDTMGNHRFHLGLAVNAARTQTSVLRFAEICGSMRKMRMGSPVVG